MKKVSCQILFVIFTACAFALLALGRRGPASDTELAVNGFELATGEHFHGTPVDWTQEHVIFSESTNAARAERIRNDPRYWLHMIRRHRKFMDSSFGEARAMAIVNAAVARGGRREDDRREQKRFRPLPRKSRIKRDWGEALGGGLTFSAPHYPAKYAFDASPTTANCVSDYVVFTLPIVGSSTQFNVIAFNNLYVNPSGTGFCAGTEPTALFTYNVSTLSGNTNSSPVLSLDGTRMAFLERAQNNSVFHVLLWKAGDVNSTFPLPSNTSPLPACAETNPVAPCMYSITVSSHSSTTSDVFVDYSADTAYTSDDNGSVFAYSPVFKGGTPTLMPGWPVTTSAGLTAAVYDFVSKNVFFANASGELFYVRTSDTSAGICVGGSPPCVGSPNNYFVSNQPVKSPPIVDSSTQKLFIFSQGAPGGGGSSITQTNTTLSQSTISAIAGTGTTNVVRKGAFDHGYSTSADHTGILYVCGQAADGSPQLTAFPVTAGVLGTTPVTATPLKLSNSTSAACSPITENFVPASGADRLFMGVTSDCISGETGGCILSVNITNGFPTAIEAHAPETGGTTGIIIDNTQDATSPTTNVYFLTLSPQPSCPDYNGTTRTGQNCAVSLTQSGLQ